MLTGWELVGVCSFVLIGHWWEEKRNTDAALKAFLTNRVGDVGLMIGVILTFYAAGSSSFDVLHINQAALSPAINGTLLLIGALCLFGGVTSKSGQFPLHTWLPDAMAGPTPVSALIHAATMVVAGVYLIARLYPVFYNGLHIGTGSFNYVALIGAFTTVFGASLAFVQFDIKRVLAYSTISQLGYMVMGLGVGAWTGGVFHLFTHAYFKACLFLCAGSVSHAAHHTFDMREMGGLRKYQRKTFVCFTIAMLALIAIPPFAGFWSKDEVLAGAAQGQHGGAYWLMLVFGLMTAFMTAAYMIRAWWMTFFGEYRGHGTPHESPAVMTVPLMILAAFSVVIGLVNIPSRQPEQVRAVRAAQLPVPPRRAHRLQLVHGHRLGGAGLSGRGAVVPVLGAAPGPLHRPDRTGQPAGLDAPCHGEQVRPRRALQRLDRRHGQGRHRGGVQLVQPAHHRRGAQRRGQGRGGHRTGGLRRLRPEGARRRDRRLRRRSRGIRARPSATSRPARSSNTPRCCSQPPPSSPSSSSSPPRSLGHQR